MLRTAEPKREVASLFFLGIGQTGKNVQLVADAAPHNMRIIEAFPYLKGKSVKEIEQIGIGGVSSVVSSITDLSAVTIYAESQAAVAVTKYFAAADDLPKQIILLSPLGFNPTAFGKTEGAQYAMLMRRSYRFWSHKNQYLRNKANRETFTSILKDSLRYPMKIHKALRYAASQNCIANAEKIARRIPVHLYVGEADEQFPYVEVRSEIGKNSSLHLHSLGNIGHLNRGTPRGMRQLLEIHKTH